MKKLNLLLIPVLIMLCGIMLIGCGGDKDDKGGDKDNPPDTYTINWTNPLPTGVATFDVASSNTTVNRGGSVSTGTQITVSWTVTDTDYYTVTVNNGGSALISPYTMTVNADVTFEIIVTPLEPVTPDVTTPTGIHASVGQTLSEIADQLPSGWTWNTESAFVGATGTRNHFATYAKVGNYLPVERSIAVRVFAYSIPFDGNGTTQNPYLINASNVRELASLINNAVSDDFRLKGNYKLVEDIDLDNAEWLPIGTDMNRFYGYFDGNDKKIYNFEITTPRRFAGLFGYSDGTITNIGVENFNISFTYTGDVFAGGLVGIVGNGGTIDYCYAIGTVDIVSTAPSGDNLHIGGLVGWMVGNMRNSFANVSVTVKADCLIYAGGLTGRGSGSTYKIEKSWATGKVVATSIGNDVYAGGIVGWAELTIRIEDCWSSGNVSAIANWMVSAGGIAGRGGRVLNCYATGDVSAVNNTWWTYVGGITGRIGQGEYVENSIALGQVSSSAGIVGNDRIAGIGNVEGPWNITNSFRHVNQIIESPSNTYGQPCDDDNLDDVNFYLVALGWSSTIWDFSDLDLTNGKLPTLIYFVG